MDYSTYVHHGIGGRVCVCVSVCAEEIVMIFITGQNKEDQNQINNWCTKASRETTEFCGRLAQGWRRGCHSF